MLKKEYGVEAPVYLKYFCVNWDNEGQYAYIKAKNEDLGKELRTKVDESTVKYFSKLAKRVGKVRRLPVEHPETTQHRALLRLISSVNVVRHQRIPVFTNLQGNHVDIKRTKAEYDFKVAPIGKQGLFNLIPTRINPSFPFYPPLTRRIFPDVHTVSIMCKYSAEEYETVPLCVWQYWCSLKDMSSHERDMLCPCGGCSKTLNYKEWRSQCQHWQDYNPFLINSIKTPLWYVFNSMVSGTSVDQVATTLSLMERVEGFKPNIEVKYLIAAVMSYMKEVGPMPYKAEDIIEKVWSVPAHRKQSGGFSLYEKGSVECVDEILDFVWDASQEDVEFPSKLSCVSILQKLLDHVKEGGKYDPYMWPMILGKLAVKAEMKAPGSNPLKCRVFFIVPYLKFLFDYLVLNDGMKHTYGKNGISIGLKWPGGDAERLARKHHAYQPGYFHIEADAEKLDQSLLAAILIVVFSLPYFMQRGDVKAEWKEVLRQLSAFVVGGCAVKLVKWVGYQALWVIGIMFSGMLGTSWGDSTYIALVLHCFDQYVYSNIKNIDPILAADYKKDFNTFAKDIYGDDMFLTYPVKYWKFIIGDIPIKNCIDLSNLSNYMKRSSGVAIKSTEAFVYVEDKSGYGPFFSVVDRDGMCVHPGPKFLQRRFVHVDVRNSEGQYVDQMAMPWRVITDYYSKAAYSFTDVDADFYWLVKWRALQLDTCGTNKKAYDFLEYLQRELMKIYAMDYDRVNDLIQEWIKKCVSNENLDERDADGIRRLYKLGVSSTLFGKHMEYSDISQMFMWNNDVQQMRTETLGIKYYNKDGTFYKPSKIYLPSFMAMDLADFA